MNARAPTAAGSDEDPCSSESVRDSLCVDPELVGDVGERRSGCIQLRRFVEDLVVPCSPFAVGGTVAVEVAGDGGSMDAELDGEVADGGAALVGLDEVVDVGGGEASLGWV